MSRDIVVKNKIEHIELAKIDAGEYRLRLGRNLPEVNELAASISEQGLLEPIGVIRAGERFTLNYGERRLAACQSLGWGTIPATVFADAKGALLAALTENAQRRGLNPLEEAKALRRAVDTGLTETAVAQAIGKTQSYVAQKLRFEQLPMGVLAPLSMDWISEGHARQLLRLRKVVTDITGNDTKYYGRSTEGDLRSGDFIQMEIDCGSGQANIHDLVGWWQDRMVWKTMLEHYDLDSRTGMMTVRELSRRIDNAIAHKELTYLRYPSDFTQEEVEEDMNWSAEYIRTDSEPHTYTFHEEPAA